MATTTKALFRGAATTTTSTTLYTVPASTTSIVTNIAITNTAGTSGTFTMSLDDVAIHSATTIAANTTVYIDLKQVLATTKTIKGGASATSINFHISGVEIA
jgi:hypothetical protein